jgi:DNA repair protein SbcC/Rad50
MRILAVRFKNLNSLVGEWHVDFTHPAYASDGIFAITGPTGAGKTTILDAVCLGLYGRTPRLEKVTKSGNEIMSRQTGGCFAEVTFETQKGRFRCHWSQHRARKQPDGELQQARHEIVDVDSGAVLETKITQVGELVKTVTGMDFDRFTRSVLLAQGGFTAFLQASADERAPILEEITGTEIYSHISMQVHERRSKEREKLELLQAELKGVELLTAEEEEELQVGLQEKRSREAEVGHQVDGLRKSGLWLEKVTALERETTDLDRQWKDVETQKQAFVPEAEKLEKSRKALALEGDYREFSALRLQQLSETKELDAAILSLPAKEKACADVLIVRQAAGTRLEEAQARQQSDGDVIKRVRDLDVQVAGQRKQIDEKDEAVESAERRRTDYKNHLSGLGESLRTIQTQLETISDYQKRQAADAGLLTSLTAIARGFKAIRDLEAKLAKVREDLAAADGKKASTVAVRKRLEADHENARLELRKKEKEATGLADEITALLKGRDVGEWRQETDALKDHERFLMQVGEIIDRMNRASTTLDGLTKSLEILRTGQLKLANEIRTGSDQKGLLEKDIGNLETKVSLLGRIRGLEEERKRLEDGSPCPLCGATYHPYAVGNIPELSDAENLLKNAKAAFKRVSEALGKLEKEQVRIAAGIAQTEKGIDEKKAVQDGDEKQIVDLLARFNILVAPSERTGKVHDALADVRLKTAEMSATVSAAEEKSKKEKAVQKALEKIRVRLDDSGKALQEAILKAEAAGLVHDRLIKDDEVLAEETRKACDGVLEDVEPFGIRQVPLNNLDTILKALQTRKETWQAQADEKTACERRAADLKAETDKTRALRSSLEIDLEMHRKDRDNLKRECESLRAARRELFGEKEADSEEKRLADAVNQAEKALEKAREDHGKIEKEMGALKEKITSLGEKTGNRATELTRAEGMLMERIRKAGFADEADYRSSCLSDEEREALAAKETSLIKKRTELEVRLKDRSEELEAEREKRLTDLPVEALREELASGESALKRLQEGIGAIKNRLDENEKLREKQQERTRGIGAQKKECFRWDELHQLIGSADGKKFRNFAQGLTFEIMVAHANRQLLKMTDRYLLIRDDSEPLELDVIDNYQAGEIRSTKNLSGGEGFIVSLSLALGLSQMASRNVRVDSLFLDEGFGTLDEDALETALETLAGLHQDGKLIGLISHVPALKERIAGQIQVIPRTGGRSVIEGPGCSAL